MIRYRLRIWASPSMALAAVVAVVAAVWLAHVPATADRAVVAARLTILAITVGLCTTWDDPAAALLAASPTSLARRRLGSLILSGTTAAVLWTLPLLASRPGAGLRQTVGLTLELVTAGAIALAVAALHQRRGNARPGTVTAPIALVGVILLGRVPDPLAPGTTAVNATATAAARPVMLVVAVVLTAAAFTDPATRPVNRHAAALRQR